MILKYTILNIKANKFLKNNQKKGYTILKVSLLQCN